MTERTPRLQTRLPMALVTHCGPPPTAQYSEEPSVPEPLKRFALVGKEGGGDEVDVRDRCVLASTRACGAGGAQQRMPQSGGCSGSAGGPYCKVVENLLYISST